MAQLALAGDTSGSITVTVPAVAGTNTLTLPAATDTLVGKATTDTLTNKTLTSPTITGADMSSMASSVITSGTAKAYNWNGLTNNTVLDFTGIPSWVKRITVVFQGVSTNGTNPFLVQLGTSGGIVSSGYVSTGNSVNNNSGSAGSNSTAAFIMFIALAADVISGTMQIVNITGNTWVENYTCKRSTTIVGFGAGDVTLSSAVTQLRVTTVGGTDTFDAGTVNILYE